MHASDTTSSHKLRITVNINTTANEADELDLWRSLTHNLFKDTGTNTDVFSGTLNTRPS